MVGNHRESLYDMQYMAHVTYDNTTIQRFCDYQYIVGQS